MMENSSAIESSENLSPRALELVEAFRLLPNPQEKREPPPREMLRFPADFPHLHSLLLNYYRQESLSEDENLWMAPYYAWRALGLSPDPSSLPVLLECLELCDPGENVDEYIEFPSLLAAHGEALLEEAEKAFAEGFLWSHDAFPAGVVLDGLRILVAEQPAYLPRLIALLRARLSRYRTNSPLLNAELIGDLAQYGDKESLPLIRRTYEEDFCESGYFSWKNLRKDFPELPETVGRGVGDSAFRQGPYMGDEDFSSALQSAGLQGRLLDKKAFMLGAILHPGSLSPSAAADEFFFDPYTEEEADWHTQGQQLFLFQQFSLLWNELTRFQEEPFPLEERLKREPVAEFPLGLGRAVSWFVDEFLRGLLLEIGNQEKNWLLRHGFMQGLVVQQKYLDDSIKAKDEAKAGSLTREIFSIWGKGYLSFAKDCQTYRMELLERRAVQEGHCGVGRNDPCPCGSGKKFKKCCLQ